MMRPKREINPAHEPVRRVLRVAGPITLAAGLLCFFGGPVLAVITGSHALFALAFLGILLLFAGSTMSMFGFMGAVARYQAQEIAPVAGDTFNYLADETTDGVRTVASAFREGLTDNLQIPCPSCQIPNASDARFCDACGAPIHSEKTCAACGKQNDADARYCKACGAPFA